MMFHHLRKRAQGESGFAMLEAILAIGLVGIVSVGLLSVSIAMSSQSKSSRDVILTRQIAEQLAERSAAHGCGLQSGSEVASVIGSVVTRCNEALDIASGVLLGDVATSIDRKSVNYVVAMRYRWLPGSEADKDTSVACGQLATMTPHAVQRDVKITWISASGDDNAYSFSQVEAVPVDSVAFTGGGALLITGMANSNSVDMQIPTDASYRLRRFASFMGSDEINGCAWFPYLSPGTYQIAGAGIAQSCSVAISNGMTTSVAFSALPTITRASCAG
jgi:type II secretory pathway pseudopilin PulG